MDPLLRLLSKYKSNHHPEIPVCKCLDEINEVQLRAGLLEEYAEGEYEHLARRELDELEISTSLLEDCLGKGLEITRSMIKKGREDLERKEWKYLKWKAITIQRKLLADICG